MSWFVDKTDNELMKLVPLLENIVKEADDVRYVSCYCMKIFIVDILSPIFIKTSRYSKEGKGKIMGRHLPLY